MFCKDLSLLGKGAYRMKPFEPKIEAAILKVLRNLRIWPCFAKSRRRIGRYGIRVRGSWESRSNQTMNEGRLQSFSKPNRNRDQNRLRRTKKRKIEIEGTVSQRSVASKKVWKQISRKELEHLQKVWTALRKVIGQQDYSKMPLWFLYLYRQTGFVTSPNTDNPRWGLPFGDDSFLHTRKFRLPSFREQQFFMDKLVGKCLSDTVTFGVVDEDAGARGIFQGSINGKSLLELWLVPIYYMQQVQELDFIGKFYANNEIWTRSLQKRKDASVAVILTRTSLIPCCSTCILKEFQDITDLYSQYM